MGAGVPILSPKPIPKATGEVRNKWKFCRFSSATKRPKRTPISGFGVGLSVVGVDGGGYYSILRSLCGLQDIRLHDILALGYNMDAQAVSPSQDSMCVPRDVFQTCSNCEVQRPYTPAAHCKPYVHARAVQLGRPVGFELPHMYKSPTFPCVNPPQSTKTRMTCACF